MAQVSLRIDKFLEGQHMAAGAIVEVRRLDATAPTGAPVTRTTIPIGEVVSERRLDLAPGRYEFSVMLPSGDVLSEIRDIGAGPEGVPVVFTPESSPHEWLSWQHALGNVVGTDSFYTLRDQHRKAGWSAIDSVTADWLSLPAPPQGREPMAAAVAAHLARDPAASRGTFSPPPGSLVHRLQSQDELPVRVFGLPPSGTFDYQRADLARHYLRVADASGRQMLCVLPYPWRDAQWNEVAVEAMVGPDQPLDAPPDVEQADVPWSVSTIARDDRIASVLSYFASGDAGAATLLARTAMDLLFGKLINPLAASAGAYVLVDHWLRSEAQSANWLSWIDNLATLFPWLPDGEALRAWVALARSDGGASLAVARRAFLEAERRGLPLYTAGVRRLEEGLTRIANQDRADGRADQSVVEALRRVRALAWNVDPRFPFTTIRLWVEAV